MITVTVEADPVSTAPEDEECPPDVLEADYAVWLAAKAQLDAMGVRVELPS